MDLTKVSLLNFRNHQNLNLDLDASVVLISGANGQGKTNVLEALYYLSHGDSFRDGKSELAIQYNQEVAHLGATVNQADGSTQLQMVLTRGVIGDKRVARKRYLVNQTPKRKDSFLGQLYTILFRPEDLRIVEGSPSRRRRYLDSIISPLRPHYAKAIREYSKALRQRNKALEMIYKQQTDSSVIDYWDQIILKTGTLINSQRRSLIESYNQSQVYQDFNLQLEYQDSPISESRLAEYRSRELAAGHTLIGPHRDDFELIAGHLGSRSLATYGSRGQQRLGVLWLQLQALNLYQAQTNQAPVLLLDDIFSELDQDHRQLVYRLMGEYQTIVTSAIEPESELLDLVDIHYQLPLA